MSTFVQTHMITAYPAANPNRDDMGRPKTVRMHDALRLRISSQSLKRALRMSPAFQDNLQGHLGKRTKRIGVELQKMALDLGASEEDANKIAKEVASIWGKIDDAKKENDNEDNEVVLSALAFISPEEEEAMRDAVRKAVAGKDLPARSKLAKAILRHTDGAIDIGMFGRFTSGEKGDADAGKGKLNIVEFGRDAAVQISHPFTTHAAIVEDDYYTGVDDLANSTENRGAAMTGDMQLGSGIYYTYASVNVDLLVKNLSGDTDLAARGLEALIEALATASPGGKANSFAHHPRASFMRVTIGRQQPCNLSAAFSQPVRYEPILPNSVTALRKMGEKMSQAYGVMYDDVMEMDLTSDTLDHNLEDLKTFAATATAAEQLRVPENA